MSVTGKIAAMLNLKKATAGDLDTGLAELIKPFSWTIADGVGASQANTIWADERTLGASASEDIDLAGSLSSQFGTAVFTKLKAIVIYALPANTNNVELSEPATNGVPFLKAAGDAIVVPPGGGVMLWAPALAGLATVTPSSGDIIRVTNSAGTTGVTYDIVLIGTDA